MDLAQLQRRVDQYVKLDLSPLYEAYRAQGGGDVDGFLAFLGASRAVDPALLKELHGMADVETPSPQDPAYKGTRLATWAQGGMRGGTAAAKDVVDLSDVRFRSISRLGEGAMGAIDIARDVYLRRKVALKTVLPEMTRHPEVLGRFLAEMQITAQLEHPNIVPVYALDVSADGSLGYAMKLVQGQDLEAILNEARERTEKGQPLGPELALDKRLEVFIKVCDALEYAHSKGIVHRDLKPANIMIGRHNEVYLMDWGIARTIGAGGQGLTMGETPKPPLEALDAGLDLPEPGETSGKDQRRTRLGEAIGTPHYMSPEQAAGKNQELDGRSDQYSMGLILQECVTLRGAVEGATIQEVLTKAMLAKRDPVAVGERPGAVPREIDAIVRKATSRDPGDRYPSVRALADDVRRYLRGEPVAALPEGALRRAGRWLARHRMATLTLLLGIGLVGAGGTIGALVDGRARLQEQFARDLRVSQMAAESAIQTQLVDRDLTRYEAALSEFVGAAQLVLSKLPASDAPIYVEESFGARESAPPDYGPSKVYGRDVSVQAALTSVAPGVAIGPVQPILRSLAQLGPAFRTLLLQSSRAPDPSGKDPRSMPVLSQRALLVDVGVPALRASIALREGATLSFPGMASRPAGDPREMAYYKATQGKAGVVWGTPSRVDGESILPVSAALHDEQGGFRGVVLVEISLSRLLARPTASELDYVESRALVDRNGTVVGDNGKVGRQEPLPPEVLRAIAARESGTLVATVNGRRTRYAYHPLSTVDWYYVASAEEERLVEGKEKIVTSEPRKSIAAPPPVPSPKPLAAPPPTTPPAAPLAAPDAGQQAPETPDAGDPAAAADAGPVRKPGPMPRASTTPNGEPIMPPNPFDKWKVYEGKKKP